MNPAFSVILLTTASGAGYGMLFWLGILNAAGVMPADLSFGIPAMFIALALATIGLLASTLHLGHPERAWRAISQWRSSWLSREGWFRWSPICRRSASPPHGASPDRAR